MGGGMVIDGAGRRESKRIRERECKREGKRIRG